VTYLLGLKTLHDGRESNSSKAVPVYLTRYFLYAQVGVFRLNRFTGVLRHKSAVIVTTNSGLYGRNWYTSGQVSLAIECIVKRPRLFRE